MALFLLRWRKWSKLDHSDNWATLHKVNSKHYYVYFKWVNFMACDLSLKKYVKNYSYLYYSVQFCKHEERNSSNSLWKAFFWITTKRHSPHASDYLRCYQFQIFYLIVPWAIALVWRCNMPFLFDIYDYNNLNHFVLWSSSAFDCRNYFSSVFHI